MFRLPLIALLLAACGATPVTLPSEPVLLETPEDYGFGTETRLRDNRAGIAVLDLLEPRFGRLQRAQRVAPAGISPAALRTAWTQSFAGTDWTPLPQLSGWTSADGAYAFGWSSGDKVYAVVGLPPASPDERAPVTILTNVKR